MKVISTLALIGALGVTVPLAAAAPAPTAQATGCTPGTAGCGWHAGQLTTSPQDDWGTEGRSVDPLLAAHYDNAYAAVFGVVEVGVPGSAGFSMQFSSAPAVFDYQQASGPPGPLDADLSDPSTSASGIFGGEVLALRLNVDFSDAGLTGGSSSLRFGDLRVCAVTNGPSDVTVREFLGVVNTALGGGSTPYAYHDLSDLTQELNGSFDDASPSAFAQQHLRTACSDATSGLVWHAGQMATHTRADWAIGRASAGTLLSDHHDTVYAATFGVVDVGIPGSAGFSMQFSSAHAVHHYLPSSGAPGPLGADLGDPKTSVSGIFGGEALALRLNVDFSDAGLMGGSSSLRFGDLRVCAVTNGPSDVTVREFLGVVNTALGGGSTPYAYHDLSDLTQALNSSFLNGWPTLFAQKHVFDGPCPQPPVVDAGSDVFGAEGSPITLGGSASDADGPSLTTAWTYTTVSGTDAGASCEFAHPTAAATTITCTDDGVYRATLTASDTVNTVVDHAEVTVSNATPTVNITAPSDSALYAITSPVNLSAAFGDAGTNDAHSCAVNWDDGAVSTGTVSQSPGSGTCTDSRTYAATGVYAVQMTVTDDDGGSATDTVMVVVYDQSAGFVTGGGWIDSPTGAYTADPTLVGRAKFSFVSKYQKGATTPTGQTEFRLHAAGLNFHSTSYEWLVLSGPKAQYKGVGTVNGASGYSFLVTITDGQVTGGGGVDKFRLRITGPSGVVYDNVPGNPDLTLAGSNPQAVGGGSIMVHASKN